MTSYKNGVNHNHNHHNNSNHKSIANGHHNKHCALGGGMIKNRVQPDRLQAAKEMCPQ